MPPLHDWLSSLRTLLGRPSRTTPARVSHRYSRRPSSFRPGVEALEERWVPTTYTVTNYGDSGVGSLRTLIAGAHNGDTIDFSGTGGTIYLKTGLIVYHNLTITAAPGQTVVIDGSQETNVGTQNSLFLVETPTIEFDNLTFTHSGDFNYSPPIVGSGTNTSMTVNNCTFTNDNGGGVGFADALTVSNCTFTSITGGCLGFSTGTITNCTFSNNTGGPVIAAGAITVTGCTFTDNATSQFSGGTIALDGNGATNVLIDQCTFTGNSLSHSVNGDGGGAIGIEGIVLTVTDCTFDDNSADLAGGAIYAGASAYADDINVSDSTFVGNTAPQGGAIDLLDLNSTYNFTEDTFTGNRAGVGGAGTGGAFYTDGTTFSFTFNLNGSIVAGNYNGATGTTADDIAAPVSSTSADNVIGTGGSGGLTNGVNGNQVGVALANLHFDPLGLQNNGGSTDTIALETGSVALNKGITHTTASTDQRGADRPIGTPSDVGAFQTYKYQDSATISGSTSQSTLVLTNFAQQLSVTVKDNSGNAVAGVLVTFTVPASGASATLAAGSTGTAFTQTNPTTYTVTTDSNGLASVLATANNTVGSYTATATVSQGAPTTFNLTNLPAFSLAKSYITVSPNLIPKNGTSTVQLHVLDASGAPVNYGGFAVAFAGAVTALGSFGPVTYVGNGVYQATFTGITAGGPDKVTATINTAAVTSTSPTITVLGSQVASSSFRVVYPTKYTASVSGGVYYYSGYFTITNLGAAITGPAQLAFTLPSGVTVSSAVGATVEGSNGLNLGVGLATDASVRFYVTFASPVAINLGITQLGLPVAVYNGS